MNTTPSSPTPDGKKAHTSAAGAPQAGAEAPAHEGTGAPTAQSTTPAAPEQTPPSHRALSALRRLTHATTALRTQKISHLAQALAPSSATPAEDPEPVPEPPAQEPQPTPTRSAEMALSLTSLAQWSFHFLTIIAAVVLFGYLASVVWTGLLPVLVSLIVCTLLAPPVGWLARHRTPRSLAILITLLGGFALVSLLIGSLTPEVTDQVETMISGVSDQVANLKDALHGPPFNLNDTQLDQTLDRASTELQQRAGQLFSGVVTGVSMVGSIAVTLGMVLVLSFFFLKDGDRFLPWAAATWDGSLGYHLVTIAARCWHTLGGFIRAQAIISFINSVVTAIGLMILGIPLAVPLAVLNFFSGFIPIFGAIVAGAVAVLVAALSKGLISALLVVALVLLIHQIEGNILSPIFQSRAMELHPVIILASIAVGGGLYGVVGAFLAVPIAAVTATIFRYLNQYIDSRVADPVTDVEIAAITGEDERPQKAARRGLFTTWRGAKTAEDAENGEESGAGAGAEVGVGAVRPGSGASAGAIGSGAGAGTGDKTGTGAKAGASVAAVAGSSVTPTTEHNGGTGSTEPADHAEHTERLEGAEWIEAQAANTVADAAEDAGINPAEVQAVDPSPVTATADAQAVSRSANTDPQANTPSTNARLRANTPSANANQATTTTPTHGQAGIPAAGVEAGAVRQDRIHMLNLLMGRASQWSLRIIAVAVALYAIGRIIGLLWEGVLPILISLILCTLLVYPMRLMRRIRAPRWLAALISLLGALALITGIFAIIVPSAIEQSGTLSHQFIAGLRMVQDYLETGPLHLSDHQINSYINEAIHKLQASSDKIISTVISGVSTASNVTVTLGVVLMITFFFLKDGHRFLPWMVRLAGRRGGEHVNAVITRSWNTLGGFIRTQALVATIDAVFIGIGLVILKVPLALPLAVLTFVGGFIPIVGAIFAGTVAVVIALVSQGLTSALIVLAIIIAVQQLEGNVLSPFLQAKAMNLHPAIVLLAVAVGGDLFGIVGAFLAVPAAAVAAVWLRYYSETIDATVQRKTRATQGFVTEQ